MHSRYRAVTHPSSASVWAPWELSGKRNVLTHSNNATLAWTHSDSGVWLRTAIGRALPASPSRIYSPQALLRAGADAKAR